jgi:hypothetical protein
MIGRSILTFAFTAFVFFLFGGTTAAQDQPTIIKDTVQVTAFTVNSYKGSYDYWSWLPKMAFRVNGPIESGGQLYVEFSQPGTGTWLKFDCATEPIQKGRWWKTECGGRDAGEAKASTYTGTVTFAIKIRNELAGTDLTLFAGRAKVAKVHTNEVGPKVANKWVYYVDQDWNLPIGYVYMTPDDVRGWKKTRVNVAFWVRGDPGLSVPHLFYQGKEVGKVFLDGQEIGKPGCESDIDHETTISVDDTLPQKAKWSRVRCTFPSILGTDKTGEAPGMFGPLYQLDQNPGDYEVKVLRNNKLARSLKFTVARGGSVDNGIASSNKIGSDWVIVPVGIIGDQDGAWDRSAWKTDAFYGNPLTGFTALP